MLAPSLNRADDAPRPATFFYGPLREKIGRHQERGAYEQSRSPAAFLTFDRSTRLVADQVSGLDQPVREFGC